MTRLSGAAFDALLTVACVWALLAINLGCTDDGLRSACPETCWPGDVYLQALGECRPGIPICDLDGKVAECVGAIIPGSEECNGLDDNCNGVADESLARPLDLCMTLGECSDVRPVCTGSGGWVCPYPLTVELDGETRCDRLDNDCDGRIDEDLFQGQYCYSGAVGTETHEPCHPGALSCVRGEAVCVNEATPTPEVCDGLDNDCDGVIDLTGDSVRFDIVLMIDVSGSMTEEIAAVAGSLDAWLSTFADRPTHRWALLIFGPEPMPYYRLTVDLGDMSAVANAVRLLSLRGGTEPVLDALYQVCAPGNMLGLDWADGAQRVAMIWGDEGMQTAIGTTTAEVNAACEATESLVYSWSTAGAFDSLAAPTGGEGFALTTSPDAMLEDLNTVLTDLCWL